MLILLFFHIVITAICSLTGFLFYTIIKEKEAEQKPLIFYPITGLIVIALISQLAVLFTPINNYFSLAFLLLLLTIAFVKKKKVVSGFENVVTRLKDQPVISLMLTGTIWLMIVVINAGPTIMDDTESYHIQMVKWANEYGTVPGIVNLHFRFGFNSSWFTTISFFLPAGTTLNFFTTLNGVISAWFCIFLVFELNPLFRQKKDNPILPVHIGVLLVLLLSLFCWPMVRGSGATANYDFITTAVTVILFVKILQQGKQTGNIPFVSELIIWPVYLFTVRIINYPLLLLAIYGFYLLIKNKEWRRMVLLFFISTSLIAAFLARNIILSGYPFFPATAFNFFNPDWKADNEMIIWLKHYIKYYNRVNEGILSIEETEKLGFPDWIFSWFRYMYYYDKPVVIASVCGLLLNLFFLKRAIRIYSKTIIYFIAVIFLQLISWFMIAPDPRFAYGCFLCTLVLLPVILLKDKILKIKFAAFINYAFISLAAIIFAYAALKPVKNGSYQNWLLPYRLPQPPVEKIVIDGIPLNIPGRIPGNWNPRCYGTDLPCLYKIDPRLHARGKAIKDGFRLDK